MIEPFPPSTTHQHDANIMLEIMSSAIEDRTATYVSAPITSGKRCIGLFKPMGNRRGGKPVTLHSDLRRKVVHENLSHARKVIRQLRRTIPGALIDPTAVADLPGWEQPDYHYFWGRVIQRYAKRVIFLSDWEYSNGCAYEFLVATQSGAETFDEGYVPLSLDDGICRINHAVEHLRSVSLPATFLQNVLMELCKLKDELPHQSIIRREKVL